MHQLLGENFVSLSLLSTTHILMIIIVVQSSPRAYKMQTIISSCKHLGLGTMKKKKVMDMVSWRVEEDTRIKRWIVYSNRHNSIRNVIEIVFLEAMHGISSFHLLRNLKTHYAKSSHKITHAFNSVVRAFILDKFEYQMQ